MKLILSMMLVPGFFFAQVNAARADQVCVGYDADGNCTGYVDTGSGGYTPNIPGVPGNPGQNPQCTCAGYNSEGACTYWVGC